VETFTAVVVVLDTGSYKSYTGSITIARIAQSV
jgi:hypothetical protein